MTFDWRQIITIDPGFPPDVHARIAQSLDQIANARDGEGIELLSKAAKLSHGHFTIAPSWPDSRTTAGTGTLHLDMQQILSQQYMQDGRPRAVSLTGVLVHEIYHVADKDTMENRTFGINDGLKAMYQKFGFSEKQMDQIERDISADSASVIQKAWVKNLSAAETQKLLREANFGDLADMFAAHPMGEMRQALYETGMFDSKGALVVEHNAVRYADEFMRKNFGDSEPWRGEYGNARHATVPATVATMTVPVPLPLGCNQPAIDGFSAPPG